MSQIAINNNTIAVLLLLFSDKQKVSHYQYLRVVESQLLKIYLQN